MGVTTGTLLQLGQVWRWKYQLDSETKRESLKVKAKRDAELVRQLRMPDYYQGSGVFIREKRNPVVAEFERDYFAWAEQKKRPSIIAIEKTDRGQLVEFTGAKVFGKITLAGRLAPQNRGVPHCAPCTGSNCCGALGGPQREINRS